MRTSSHGPDAGSHDTHDRLLVAAAAAGDLAGPELATAQALLTTCPDCRVLHTELLAIAAATRHLPAPVRPPAMDYRITADRAAALARGGLWRRLLGPFGRSGSPAIRPLAGAFTTLGVAGLLFATLPNLSLGGATGSGSLTTVGRPGETRDITAASAEPEVAVPPGAPSLAPTDRDTAAEQATGEPFGSLAQPLQSAYADGSLPSFTSNTKGGSNATEPPGFAGTATAPPEVAGATTPPPESEGDRLAFAVTDDSGGPSPLVLLSLGLLAIGLGLFLLRLLALRLR
jgi:hypothetical protein